MQMSRGAFYKYFQNLEDAYTYLIHKCSISVHNAILSSIQQHAQDFFLGIEQFLIHCSELDRNSDYWKKLQLLTQNNEIQAMKRTQMSPNSPMVKQWLTLLSANHFVMNSLEEALSFLYFIMALVMNALTDCVVNNWSTEELVIDFRFRKDWLLQGVTK
jgi:AcrR family transcriptional regulator